MVAQLDARGQQEIVYSYRGPAFCRTIWDPLGGEWVSVAMCVLGVSGVGICMHVHCRLWCPGLQTTTAVAWVGRAPVSRSVVHKVVALLPAGLPLCRTISAEISIVLVTYCDGQDLDGPGGGASSSASAAYIIVPTQRSPSACATSWACMPSLRLSPVAVMLRTTGSTLYVRRAQGQRL